MLTYPQIDPVIFSVGPVAIRWYGLMYVLGFIASYLLVQRQIVKHRQEALAARFDNLNLVLILSVIAGGRLGYVLFYNPGYYFSHPAEIVATWQGGMSFHGACLALLLSGLWFCRHYRLDFWITADFYAATAPIGLGLGRIGNFLNGELYGRVTDVPWAMVFPDGGPLPRHPSQIYEVLLEGALLFVILWLNREKTWQGRWPHRGWPHGAIAALFLIGYGLIRIFVENFRQPDAQLGFLFDFVTMGQLLSGCMILGGLVIWWRRRRGMAAR
ncbi:MAG: prolipoprotein diacylglyceryl transferase [Desulfobulbaceae bacterium]|jgi:phosphatidylglycerol:prolipoprotein diacylglycerol transferase|nr:prolipoprotein diacylglyceryl transferase [Desulfobulbaceae bacterium]